MILLLLKGALLGAIITAPPGPIGTLCINRALDRGFWAGFSVGLGTALGDSTYALVAVAGLAMFAKALATVTIPLAIGGGLLLLWLGWQRLSTPPVQAADIRARDFLRTTFATFFLTISNPATILSFGALFAGFGLAQETGATSATLILAGVFAGSLLWWFALSGVVSLARDRLSDQFTAGFGRASGYLLILFGCLAIGSSGYSLLA
ncbi:LysE family translocator [Neorhizobium sp. P12A]|jgi:putative LysE/RhtB family amino acid efflux pump|uniref:LysE family translocator n=1 Tax=Neorhizobium sp. P12A TaxID=2268027 RepID=UPI0011ECA9F5|nr:LysE family transporter [Neorhizobium sp. P12A]KAA0697519.1 LysE family translocator [Neorhizobium sp. P12A]